MVLISLPSVLPSPNLDSFIEGSVELLGDPGSGEALVFPKDKKLVFLLRSYLLLLHSVLNGIGSRLSSTLSRNSLLLPFCVLPSDAYLMFRELNCKNVQVL